MTEPMQPVSEAALTAFDKAHSQVEVDVVERCMAEDYSASTMGPEAEKKIRAGLGFVSKMLRATMVYGAQGILNDQMDWGKTRLPEYGVSMDMVLGNFKRYTDALRQRLPDEVFAEIAPYLDYMVKMQAEIAGKQQP